MFSATSRLVVLAPILTFTLAGCGAAPRSTTPKTVTLTVSSDP